MYFPPGLEVEAIFPWSGFLCVYVGSSPALDQFFHACESRSETKRSAVDFLRGTITVNFFRSHTVPKIDRRGTLENRKRICQLETSKKHKILKTNIFQKSFKKTRIVPKNPKLFRIVKHSVQTENFKGYPLMILWKISKKVAQGAQLQRSFIAATQSSTTLAVRRC